MRCEYCELCFHQWDAGEKIHGHSPKVEDEDRIKGLTSLIHTLAICGHGIRSSAGLRRLPRLDEST